MKQGFIKARTLSPEERVADVKFNTAKIIQAIWDSDERGVKLLVLPELCVSSATCGDLFLQRPFLDACEGAVRDIADATYEKQLVAVIGAPLRQGGRLYSCAIVICNGKILGAVPKTTLSADEKRYFCTPDGAESNILIKEISYPFSPRLIFECAQLRELKIGVEFGAELFSSSTVAHDLCARGATVIACPSAMPEVVGLEEERLEQVRAKSRMLKCAYLVASAGECESTTDAIYGANNIICENGQTLAICQPFFEENGDAISEVDVCFLCDDRIQSGSYASASGEGEPCSAFSLDLQKTTLTRHFDPSPFTAKNIDDYEKILTMQSLALARRLFVSGSKTAVLGISGGLDSTLALLVLVRACEHLGWDKKAIHCITMPCFGTTKRTKSNAILLCESLGVTIKEIDISRAVGVHFEDLGIDMNDRSVAFENGQARERTQVLMDYANTVGGLVVGTGDLSEIALGWCTYNADHMSMYNPNCDIPKTLVRELVFYEAGEASVEVGQVLSDILATPVSPELLPPDKDGKIAQKTEDLVGPYELHDFFLYYFIKKGFAPSKIYRVAKHAFSGTFDDETIYKWLCVFIKRFFTQQFKRSCSPDGVRVGPVALSPRAGLKMPSDATYWVWLDELNNNKDY
ncbi:MAG: NAD(+) synthase [Clostridia bacterium]|nr:NAD(+) synthase [Clostridia bacterium]